VYEGLGALRRSLPDTPSPHIVQGLQRIDAALVESASSVFSEDRLRENEEKAADDVVRIEGMHRAAFNELDELTACGGIADEVPPPLANLLARLEQEIAGHSRTANQAVSAAADIPSRADQCERGSAATLTAGAEGRLTGRCQGAIEVTPLAGRPGSPLSVRVTIDAPGAQAVTRVVADNPGCAESSCREMRLQQIGLYSLILTLRAPANAAPAGGVLGRFRLNVSAYQGDRALCSGQSREIKVMAP
jgi:hypothetical protein